MKKRHANPGTLLFALIIAAAPLGGCVYPYPGYYAGGTNYDAAWNAALGGAQDAGVMVTTSDRSSGIIRGSSNGSDVVITVLRQGDGSVRVQFDAKGPTGRDPALGDRFSRAYDRRMGR
jgi:hypothetical protein